MKQEEKELLLKDLCSRLPYGVKISVLSWDEREMEYTDRVDVLYSVNGDEYIKSTNEDYDFSLEDIKPYLFPLSSMTDEQKQYLKNRFCYDWDGEPYDLWKCQIEIGDADELIDWLHKNHFDYRNLINKNIAIDCTNLNIY